jgi:hypothetical protein
LRGGVAVVCSAAGGCCFCEQEAAARMSARKTSERIVAEWPNFVIEFSLSQQSEIKVVLGLRQVYHR